MCCAHWPQVRSSHLKHSTNCSTRSARPSTSWPASWRLRSGGSAMAKTTWGRKETIIWPRHMPIYTYGLAFAIVALTFVAACVRIHLTAPLQRYYLPVYERASAFGAFTVTHRSTARMLFVSGPEAAPRPAMNDDVTLGRTLEPDGRPIPLTLSADAHQHGYSLLFRGPERSYV